VAWGRNWEGEGDVPSGNQFVDIAAGASVSFAIEVPEPSTVVGLVVMATFMLICARRRGDAGTPLRLRVAQKLGLK